MAQQQADREEEDAGRGRQRQLGGWCRRLKDSLYRSQGHIDERSTYVSTPLRPVRAGKDWRSSESRRTTERWRGWRGKARRKTRLLTVKKDF